MNTVPITVTDQHGKEIAADQMVCSECNGFTFLIFAVQGKHQHIQCVWCGTSYCDSTCSTPN